MSTCKEYDAGGHEKRTIQCDHGCCGTSVYQKCCDYALSDTVIIVVCVVGALIVIAIVIVLIICIINSKKHDRVVRLRPQRRSNGQGRRRPELPKPPPYSELPPEYTSVADSNVYHTGLCVHTGQSNYTAQSRFHGHSRRGGQSNNIDSTIDLQHQGVAEYGYSSLPRPDRNNAGLYPPPTPSTSASVSSLDCRPTQRLLQKNNQKERSTNKRKTTHIPVLTTRSKRQTDTASTSSTRAASTSTAGESVSTIESLPGMPLPDEQKPVSNREQRDVYRTAILKKLQLRKADLETMSGEYI